MHIVKELPTAIFVNDAIVGCVERIDQMPVPVMQIDTDIFTEVP